MRNTQQQAEVLEIPPMIDRPIGYEDGPRIIVRNIKLSGAVNREEQALKITDLEALVDRSLSEQPAEGFSINQLQVIADRLTRHYREAGFIVAQAIVPAQDVQDGTVSIQILEGFLEDVVVERNSDGLVYKDGLIKRPFRGLEGQPIVQGSIEQALLDIQDFPGLSVFGTITPGEQVGNSDLVVEVLDERRLYVTPRIDNYGSEFTGEFRANLDFQVNNLFGLADQMSGYVLQTFEPTNGTYGGLYFNFPMGQNSVAFSGSTNQFDVGGQSGVENLEIEGTVDQVAIDLNHVFSNGRFFGANGRLGVAIKNAKTDSNALGIPLAEDNLSVVTLAFNFFTASRSGRGYRVGAIELHAGIPDWLGSMDENGDEFSSRVGGDGTRAGGDFTKVRFNFQNLWRVNENNSLELRLDGQWSDDMLVALEQYAIGGPQNVRAYPIAQALADTGGSATAEWVINAPGFADKPALGDRTWGEIFQLAFYADYAYGELNNPLESQESTVNYSGYGMGLQFNLYEKIDARFDLASPIGGREPENGRDPQYYFRMSYTF